MCGKLFTKEKQYYQGCSHGIGLLGYFGFWVVEHFAVTVCKVLVLSEQLAQWKARQNVKLCYSSSSFNNNKKTKSEAFFFILFTNIQRKNIFFDGISDDSYHL